MRAAFHVWMILLISTLAAIPGEGFVFADHNPEKYEAESAELLGTVVIGKENGGYSGSGYVERFLGPGSGVKFTVNVPEAGEYNITLRYANGNIYGKDGSLGVYVNGERRGSILLANLNTDNNYSEWGEVSKTILINAGTNTIALLEEEGAGVYSNLDYISLEAI
jgi:hypothetical protein